MTTGPALPLALAGRGDLVTIQRVEGCPTLRQRLIDLGLNPGATVRIMQNERPGPMIVAVKQDGRLALGRGMAHHILVVPAPNP